MDSVMDKVNEMYEMFMDLPMLKKAVVLLVVGLVVYYVYKHFFLKEDMENGENGVLRFFYADWCPHCNSVKPEWEKLTKKYKGQTQLKKVDCSNGRPSIAKKLNVEGFPTFILSKNGKNIEYDGERTTNGLLSFLNEN
tara:strand:- start:48 stop:461 length:414 start_codon:yes stop_codon:yes gene_type:complete